MVSIMMYIYLGFLVLQREWGISVLFFITYIILEYIFENDKKIIIGNILLAGMGGCVGYLTMYHIQVRISNWLDPWSDAANKGYQIVQSLFAIEAGGFFGSGIGLGKPEFIPEVHTDFIFSAICEEMGMFGGVAVILMFAFLIWRLYVIAMEAEDLFGTLLVVGVMAHIAIQVILNIAVVTNTIPNTGITLPFISYGGSSVLFLLAEIGLALSVSRKK